MPANHPAEPPVSRLVFGRGEGPAMQGDTAQSAVFTIQYFLSLGKLLCLRSGSIPRAGVGPVEKREKEAKETSVPRYITTQPFDLFLHQGESVSS